MEECEYCGGNCPDQVTKNGRPRIDHVCDNYLKTYMAKYVEYDKGDK